MRFIDYIRKIFLKFVLYFQFFKFLRKRKNTKQQDYLFYRCVVCGRKSSDSVKIGGGTISFSRKEPPDLWITICLCNKCDKKYGGMDLRKQEDLWNEFIKLYNGEKI